MNKDYYTVKQIANMSNINLTLRSIQKKAKRLKENDNNIDIRRTTNGWMIHKGLLSMFEPVYKRTSTNPIPDAINITDWNLFCDFVPEDETPMEVLQAIMRFLFTYLKDVTKKPLKLYYVIEEQPRVGKHVHYFIKSEFDALMLQYLIERHIEILCLSDQDNVKYKNEIKSYATEYLNKGKKFNWKNAVFIYAELLIVGRRK